MSDLQQIQSQVVSYWQAKQHLPATLADLTDSISGYSAPTDPQTGQPYEYSVKWAQGFELCASFNAVTQPYSAFSRTTPAAPTEFPSKVLTADSWQHGAGRVCYERTIDPALYPPFKK